LIHLWRLIIALGKNTGKLVFGITIWVSAPVDGVTDNSPPSKTDEARPPVFAGVIYDKLTGCVAKTFPNPYVVDPLVVENPIPDKLVDPVSFFFFGLAVILL
jgi:hypothetical protein